MMTFQFEEIINFMNITLTILWKVLTWEVNNEYMKKYLFGSFILIVCLLLLSCEVNNSDPEPEPVKDSIPVIKPDPEYFFKIGKKLYYRYSDIELYDSSTHIIYFKTNHPEFDKNSQSYFSVIVKSDTVYNGDFWPMFRSDNPKRVIIATYPFWLPNYALWIENNHNIKPDLRNTPSIIEALKDHNLLHPGLLIEIKNLEVTSTQVTFSFSVTNKDQSALWIMDPDKMGIRLFHYYTNGLIFKKLNDGSSFTIRVPSESPSDNKIWKIEWLTKLNSGDTKTFNFIYPLSSPIAPGEYTITFVYPGFLFQISKDQLIQDNARIWLGKARTSIRKSI